MQSISSTHSSGLKITLAVVLCFSLLTTGCSSQWLSTAIADLPVLTQMALNIATLVTTLQEGSQLQPAEVAAIQRISSEASADLNLLQSLYNEYRVNPNANTLQKIHDSITTISESLPSMLQAAHISDPTLSARVTAGVNLILTTVSSFSALMPRTSPVAAQNIPGITISIPSAKDLKKQWNQQVCSPAPTFKAPVSGCVVR